MLNSLAGLRDRAKAQIAAARRQTPKDTDLGEIDRPQDLAARLKRDSDVRKERILRDATEAEAILPSTATDDTTSRAFDSQLIDSWAKIVSEFKRQLDSSPDLRAPLADETVTDEQPGDHSTVKFFKGLLNEWRLRLYALDDAELTARKPELTMMWYCTFALQPLFNGFNEKSLSADISIETGKIASALKKMQYKLALDHYNLLAIGKSLWPIGVTNYSIHWKFSCDLIDSDRVLHIFNSESGRNAILSIKRLMTKHQEFHNVREAF